MSYIIQGVCSNLILIDIYDLRHYLYRANNTTSQAEENVEEIQSQMCLGGRATEEFHMNESREYKLQCTRAQCAD